MMVFYLDGVKSPKESPLFLNIFNQYFSRYTSKFSTMLNLRRLLDFEIELSLKTLALGYDVSGLQVYVLLHLFIQAKYYKKELIKCLLLRKTI